MSDDILLEVRSLRRVDITLTVVGLPLAALGLVAGFFCLALWTVPTVILAIPMLAFGVGFASLGGGALWRMIDPGPLLTADAAGLRFHPAHFDGLVPWTDIGLINVRGQNPPYLVVTLHRRIWALEAPFTARRIRIGMNYADLGHRRARKMIQDFGRLRRNAAMTDPAYPDPDAAD